MRFKTQIASLILVFSIVNSLPAQEYRGIKNPGANYQSKCKKCLQAIQYMPPEVQFSLFRDQDNNLYFSLSDSRYLEKFFSKSKDGIAVDILTKDQFSCGADNDINNSWISMGKLVGPFFYKDFKDDIRVDEYNYAYVKLGKVPSSISAEDVEFNLILIDNGYLCFYQAFYDLARYKWDLLDMGLYTDSIKYGINYDTSSSNGEISAFLNSRMKFVIPFEQDKWEFKEEDIKPFYDSLKLENFNIRKIELRAYASVEGSTDRNLELQQKRAESIINVLQEKQLMEMEQKITTSENWVEFYHDIANSQFDNLSNLSKTQIKEKLKDKVLLENIEYLLKKHRKAVLLIDVERKTTLNETKEIMISQFQKAIEDNNLEKAAEIQQSIYAKVINKEFSPDVLGGLDIPRKNNFGVLINNDIAFKHFLFPEDVLETYKDFQELDQLMPENKKVKYNLCAMKFRIWILGLDEIDPVQFEKEISALKRVGISSSLVKRMMINFNVIMSEYHNYMGDYAKKDEALGYIRKNYRYVSMSNTDLLSLAQYFSAYAKYDWAIKLLTPKVEKIDTDEDLLFYFVNLTIVDPEMLKRSSYKTILRNAFSVNRNRFCSLFNSIENKGVSFQLLKDPVLKEIYCEDCQGKWL